MTQWFMDMNATVRNVIDMILQLCGGHTHFFSMCLNQQIAWPAMRLDVRVMIHIHLLVIAIFVIDSHSGIHQLRDSDFSLG